MHILLMFKYPDSMKFNQNSQMMVGFSFAWASTDVKPYTLSAISIIHKFSHFHSSDSFPHHSAGEWLGLNHVIPSLNSHLTHHSHLGRTSCIPPSLSHRLQLPLLPIKAVFSKEYMSIICRAPVVSTVWPHVCVDHSAFFACHLGPLLS